MRRPRAVWATAIPPAFAGGGGHMRQAHLLTALAERADVHLVVAGTLTDPRVRAACASVREIDRALPPEPRSPTRRRLRDLSYSLGLRQPFEMAQHRGIVRRLRPAIRAVGNVDVVQVEYVGLAPLVDGRRPGEHWAITLHNLPSVMAEQRAALAPGARQRMIYRAELANARRWEPRVVRAYDTTIVVSPADGAALGDQPLLVPNGVDLDRLRPSPPATGARLLFTGALYTEPNIDGLLWFLRDIWPLVRAGRPDAELAVVGLQPPPIVVEACSVAPRVTLHADVPDVGPHLERAAVAVVPMRIGSGTRLKALDALAAGRPVVGTAIGLDGLGLVDGEHVDVADDAKAFAAAIGALLHDPGRAAARAAAGRRHVEEHFDWRAVSAAYVDALLRRAGS